MYGFIKSGKHSYNDFNLRIIEREFNPPNKVKIKETVPGMNGAYDFSTIATNGEETYEERVVKYVLDLRCSKIAYGSKKFQISNWLSTGLKDVFYDDLIPGYHFLAECEELEFNENPIGAEITVQFVCYPFMISNDYEGSDIWDTFNFDIDLVQDVEFDVAGSKTVNIVNVGLITKPTINVDAAMSMVFDSKTYSLAVGDNTFYDFKLANGNNSITITGTGHIKFLFLKEML